MDAGGQLWDAIVVGAGPAGCAAAYDLAVAGQSVLLVDKRDFPRNKACAGGLTIKAVKATVAEIVKEESKRDLKRSAALVEACFKSSDFMLSSFVPSVY